MKYVALVFSVLLLGACASKPFLSEPPPLAVSQWNADTSPKRNVAQAAENMSGTEVHCFADGKVSDPMGACQNYAGSLKGLKLNLMKITDAYCLWNQNETGQVLNLACPKGVTLNLSYKTLVPTTCQVGKWPVYTCATASGYSDLYVVQRNGYNIDREVYPDHGHRSFEECNRMLPNPDSEIDCLKTDYGGFHPYVLATGAKYSISDRGFKTIEECRAIIPTLSK